MTRSLCTISISGDRRVLELPRALGGRVEIGERVLVDTDDGDTAVGHIQLAHDGVLVCVLAHPLDLQAYEATLRRPVGS